MSDDAPPIPKDFKVDRRDFLPIFKGKRLKIGHIHRTTADVRYLPSGLIDMDVLNRQVIHEYDVYVDISHECVLWVAKAAIDNPAGAIGLAVVCEKPKVKHEIDHG